MREVPEYFYEQSGVIPYRRVQGTIEVLMITSRKKKRWVIPKGVKEPELSPAESAAKEALEEAGVEGRLSSSPLGFYRYSKWGGTCNVEVYAMEVETVFQDWEESHRHREWVSVMEAIHRTREKGLKRLIQSLEDGVRDTT